MTGTLDKTIREKIGEILAAALCDAKIYTWNALSRNLSEWPGMFRTENGTHGWIVKLRQQTAERKNGQRDKVTLVYDIWGFYEFRTGKADDNSDNDFCEELAKAYNAIKAEPRLTLESEVEYHDLLQFGQIVTAYCGEETLHFAQGQLAVHLCC